MLLEVNKLYSQIDMQMLNIYLFLLLESILLRYSEGDEEENQPSSLKNNSQWVAAESAHLLKTPKSNFLKASSSVPLVNFMGETKSPNNFVQCTQVKNTPTPKMF